MRAFSSGLEFLEHNPAVPGCLVLDLNMPKLNGLQLQSELAARNIPIPIVFLTGHGDVPSAVRAMKDGAVDFVTKPFRAKDLMAAIQRAMARDSEQRSALAEREVIQRRAATLTERESQVFGLVIQGLLNKQIGDRLGIAERTVKVHRGRLLKKMGVSSVAELARAAERAELTFPPLTAPDPSAPRAGTNPAGTGAKP